MEDLTTGVNNFLKKVIFLLFKRKGGIYEMRWLLASLLLLLAGCYSAEKVKNGVLKWEYFREIDGYEVTVYIQRNENGLCLLRDVIMHFRVGMRFDMLGDKPQYVRALDVECDERFDMFYFRNPLDEQRTNKFRLTERLNFYFYATAPIWQHPQIIDLQQH